LEINLPFQPLKSNLVNPKKYKECSMESKLYVGNISWDANEDSLTELFSKVGEVVSAKLILDKFTGKSKGFGFVEMSSSEEAEKAIAEFDGTEFLGRPLKVNIAKPPKRHDNGFNRR